MDAASLDKVLDDPHWFVDGFDPQTGTLGFTQVSRAQLVAQPFLDMRWNRAGHRRGRTHLSGAVAWLASRSAPRNLRFIWHTGFCCSTLLAQALDAPARNLSLCEPQLLVEVADAKRAGAFAKHPDLAKLPDVAFKLLSRGFAAGEAVTLKPAPAANHLLPEAMSLAESRHLFLFSDCESFLLSISKLGADGANYVRAMLGVMQRDGAVLEWTEDKVRGLSPLQIAALVWHLQIAEFRRCASPHARSLNCDALLAGPGAVLKAVDDFFGLGLGTAHMAAKTEGPLFRRNAKNPGEAFDASRRRDEHEAARKHLGARLGDAVAWSYEAFADTPSAAPLAHPLIPFEKAIS
jgi:hypothetical protein